MSFGSKILKKRFSFKDAVLGNLMFNKASPLRIVAVRPSVCLKKEFQVERSP